MYKEKEEFKNILGKTYNVQQLIKNKLYCNVTQSKYEWYYNIVKNEYRIIKIDYSTLYP